MQRLTVSFASTPGSQWQSLHVPDITTALVVAQINIDQGEAQILDGERLVATLKKGGQGGAPFWHVR